MSSMGKRNTVWPALGAMLLCLAACGKKEGETPAQPTLSAPESAFTSIGQAGKPEKVAAQAEVKASSGPVELSLLLYKTQIKLGDSLWHQLRIRNVGDRRIIVTDQVFHDPWQLKRQIPGRYGSGGYGIYIEVIGPDGEPLDTVIHREGSDIADHESGLLKIDGSKEQAMVDGWRRQGLSESQITHKLLDYNIKKRSEDPLPRQPVIRLKPGERAETKSWFFHSTMDRIKKKPVPQPIGDFSELEFFNLDRPGKYKVRAVYDRAPTQKLNKMRGKLPVYPEEVLIRTPWTQVTVLP